jgi:beta-1,4-mannosyltransferase
MQYHALSFAKEGFGVDLVGFDHSPLIKELQDQSLVRIVPINEPPKKPSWLPRLLYYVFKTIYLFMQLVTVVLWKTSKHSHVLVQNPPAIPTLAAAWLISIIRQLRFIIDWHNYGYTILSLAVGSTNPLVKFSKFYEGVLGRRAAYNICVTQAMRVDLRQRWGVVATTLYDRPPQRFRSIDEYEKHKIFLKLSESYNVFKSVDNKVCITFEIFRLIYNKNFKVSGEGSLSRYIFTPNKFFSNTSETRFITLTSHLTSHVP